MGTVQTVEGLNRTTHYIGGIVARIMADTDLGNSSLRVQVISLQFTILILMVLLPLDPSQRNGINWYGEWDEPLAILILSTCTRAG